MPVEITLPLTKLEQAVADARANEQVMAAKVEDAKLVLKAAKVAWEESVGEVFRALDEMIADKKAVKQRGLFDDDGDDGKASGEGGGEPTPGPVPPAAPTGGSGDPVTTTATVTVQEVSVEIITATTAISPSSLSALAALSAGPKWRAMPTTELEAPEPVFAALDAFGVFTLGNLADALKNGQTFNLKLVDVLELQEAIEDVSQEDEHPLKFDKDVKVTVKDEGEAEEEEVSGNSDVLSNLFTPEPEPAKPAAKKGRGGRKPKTGMIVTESGEVVVEVKELKTPEPVEPKSNDFDGL